MAANCIFDDYVLRKRTAILFGEEAMQKVIDKWETPDPMLMALESIPTFAGRHAWKELDPLHWRLLIANTMNQRDKNVPKDDFFNDTHKIVGTLYFLIMGLIYSLQLRTTGAVDTIRIMRITEIDLTFEITVTMMAERKKPAAPPSGLSVVVDNTK